MVEISWFSHQKIDAPVMYRLAQLSGGSNHFRKRIVYYQLSPKNVEAIGENQVEIRKFYFFFGGRKQCQLFRMDFLFARCTPCVLLFFFLLSEFFFLKKIWAYIFHDGIWLSWTAAADIVEAIQYAASVVDRLSAGVIYLIPLL